MNMFTEIQNEHINLMNAVRSRLYDILHKYTDKKDIKCDLVNLLEFVFEDMQTVQKDINIEAFNGEIENASLKELM